MPPISGPGRSAADAANRGYVRFMVLGDARTGTTMLVQALNSHPATRCFREILNFAQPFVDFEMNGYDNDDPEACELRAREPVRFLRERIFGQQPADVTAVGFKFHYGHFWGYPDLLQHLVDDTDLRIVHLTRRNSLRTLVSLRIAQTTGQWYDYKHTSLTSRLRPANVLPALRDPLKAVGAIRRSLEPEREKPADLRVKLSVEECRAFFAKTEHEIEHWDRLFANHERFDVVYEDVVADAAVAAEMQRFLDLDPQPPRVTLRRQNPEPLSELVAGYDELRTAFADTRYAAYFD